MKKFLITAFLLALMANTESDACTNFIVTKGASTDGSTMVTYAADSHMLYGALYKYNAPAIAPNTIPIYEWDTGKFLSEISNPQKTYSTVGNMNEHQLVIGETTFGGRSELVDSTGRIDYGSLIYITLQRAKSAREAITTIVDLANTYGYASSGESFSIADANEAWIFEMIGKGCVIKKGENKNKGIVWVARRIPDGYVSGHANQARISQFPLDDPENCMYAPDVISFAKKSGYFDGKDEDFSFCDAYAPLDFFALRACEARVWSFFNSVNSQMGKYVEYAMGDKDAARMPLWIKPDKKVAPKQLFDAMRDHYEGTPMDMTQDVGAGVSHRPYRWRPMTFEYEGEKYLNERATATQQTGFWFVAQTRDWLPSKIGGLLWFGVDDAATSCLTPIYCGSTQAPLCFKEGNGHLTEYSATSAFWLFNRVAQFAYLRYDLIGKEVQKAANQWEIERLEDVKTIDKQAKSLYDQSPERAVDLITNYSTKSAQKMFDTWVELDRYLMVKYIDGYVKQEDERGFKDNGNGRNVPAAPKSPEYSEEWKARVVKDNGEILKIKK